MPIYFGSAAASVIFPFRPATPLVVALEIAIVRTLLWVMHDPSFVILAPTILIFLSFL